jgi:Mor family transcriptional regulator
MLNSQEICNLYNQGQSQKEIALQYNYSGGGIGRILRKNNIRGRRLISQEIISQVFQEYKLGDNAYTIAEKYNFTPLVVYYNLKKNGIKIRDFLYKDATIFIDRKKEKFDSISKARS